MPRLPRQRLANAACIRDQPRDIASAARGGAAVQLSPRHTVDGIEHLTRGIIGKLLHEPSVALKDAAGSPRGDRLVSSLRELFGLGADEPGQPAG